ncbi:MAG: glycosyltransferase [Pseudolabrys sp.]|nr:glycosyltransferase [Pseudolabrys sp.]
MQSKNSQSLHRIVDVSPYTPLAIGFGGIARSTGAYLLALLASKRTNTQVVLISTTASMRGHVSAKSVENAYPGLRAHLYNPIFSKKWGVGLGLFIYLPIIFVSDLVVIHGTRNWPSVIAASICRLFGRPYFVVGHATLDVSRMQRTQAKRKVLYSVTSRAVIWSVRGASAIIVSGPLERHALPESVNKIPVVEIENFYDFDLSRSPSEVVPTRRRYLFVGRIESDKGILAFIQIWKSVASPDSTLVIVGSGAGKYFDDVTSAIHGNGRITYLGELEKKELQEVMLASSILVLPTGLDDPVTENFGNTVAEALIFGRPAMVTKGLHWDKYASSPALVIFEKNEGAVAQAIREFDQVDDVTYRQMSTAAAQLSQEFHISKAVSQLRKLIDNVLGA